MRIADAFHTHCGQVRFGSGPAWAGGELFRAADELVSVLREIPETVAVLLEGRPDPAWVAAMVAIWRAGHVAVPFTPGEGALRREEAVRISGARWVLDPSGDDGKRLSSIAAGAESGDGAAAMATLAAIEEHRPALVLFSSGSTGTPKGVVLSHDNLRRGARNVIRHFGLREQDHGMGLLPLTHVNGIVTTLIAPILSGGSVTFLDGPFSPERFQELCRRLSPTWASGVPFHYERLVDRGPEWIRQTSIRFFRSAAAPLKPETIRTFERRTGKPLIETMGMTECSGQIFANPLPPAVRKPGSVGMPVDFEVEFRTVPEACDPAGREQEICVRGPALARGCIDENGECRTIASDRFLETGDLGFMDDDGFVHVTGRRKEIVIVGGINIPLRPLETELAVQPGVRDAALHAGSDEALTVYCVPAKNGRTGRSAATAARDTGPAASVTPASELESLSHALAASLRRSAPAPVRIDSVIFVAHLPRSPTGKLLRGRLPACRAIRRFDFGEARPGALSLLAERLEIPEADLDDGLAMGAHAAWDSLLQVEIGEALERDLGRRLTPPEMRQAESIGGIRRLLAGQPSAAPAVTQDSRALNAYLDAMAELGLGCAGVSWVIVTRDALMAAGIESIPDFVAALIERRGDTTVVMNAFSWSFCTTGRYHFRDTPSETGLVAEHFRKHPASIRTPHPIYSFSVAGPVSFLETEYVPDAWGRGSVLDRLCESPEVKVILDGPGMLRGNPSIHLAEQRMRVPYRRFKRFYGRACFHDDVEERCHASMYVRSERGSVYENDWGALVRYMEERRLFECSSGYPSLYAYRNMDLVQGARYLLDGNPMALAGRRTPT